MSDELAVRSVRSTDFRRSASTLGGGIATAIVGQALALLLALGGAQYTVVALGALVALVGMCVGAYGLYLMARNVDVAAKVAAESLARSESDARARGRGESL